MLAPRDSQKQIDADFYGGMWESVSGAFEGAWTTVTDPAQAIAGVVQAAAHPVDTAKNMIAYDDWTTGREPRALGRNAGDLFLSAATLGAGKIASVLGRETRIAGEHPHPEESPPREPETPGPSMPAATTPAARSDAVRNIVLGEDGVPHGREDSRRVYMVSEPDLASRVREIREQLGTPEVVHDTPKGRVETWKVDPEANTFVTFRTFSSSGGATIDVNLGRDFPVKRFHLEDGLS